MERPEYLAPLRRAALSLHGLAEPDRTWILDALEPAHGAALQSYLKELSDIGIPRDSRLLDALLTGGHDQPVEMRQAPALNLGILPDVAKLLRQEPPIIAAAWLVRLSGPCRAHLAALFDASFKAEVGRVTSAAAHAPALQSAVERVMQQAVADLAGEPPLLRAWWHRLRTAYCTRRGA